MKLYHGTSYRSASCIEAEGFAGSELSEFTDGFSHIEDGVVFLTEDIQEAQEYGEIVIEVHLEGVEAHPFSDGNTDHFYAIAEEVNDQAWWESVGTK